MKRIAVFLLSMTALAGGQTQTNQTDVLIGHPGLSPEQIDHYVQFQTRTINRIFGVNVQYGGVLPMIREADNPWQLINPFAPLEYGDGFDNVSIDLHSKQPRGIYLFTVKF